MEKRCFDIENTTGYLKNRWTKHRLVCIHFDLFHKLIPDMDTILNISEIFECFSDKIIVSALNRDVERVSILETWLSGMRQLKQGDIPRDLSLKNSNRLIRNQLEVLKSWSLNKCTSG